jgi:hypothetical protein
VVFAQPIEAGATARVMVEDTTRADARAEVVAQVFATVTEPRAAGEWMTFQLTVPDVDERARYDVRAYVDCSGSGAVSSGDRITTQAYPVLTHGAADRVEVEVEEI